MRIVIIGSGNVAYHLAKAFQQAGLQVAEIFGRNEAALKTISENFQIPFSTTVLADADLYLIAVKDDAIEKCAALITKENCLVAHTAGSLAATVLKGPYRKAVFYPLQTFTKDKNLDYSKIPFFIETDDDGDFKTLETLASSISSHIMRADYDARKYVHLSAVFACNFVNHLFAQAQEILNAQNIPFEYLLPLIKETTTKIETTAPREAQTGPAIRNDQRVLAIHESLIEDEEQLKIYKVMNESIKKMYEL